MRNIVLLVLVLATLVGAQTEYPKVMDNGGGRAINPSYVNLASIGQAVIGISSLPDKVNQAGYITIGIVFLEVKDEQGQNVVLPKEISIGKLYPNPFNSICRIDVFLPQSSDIFFQVFNLVGCNIFYQKEYLKVGVSEIIFNPANLPSGIYLYRLSIGNKKAEGKFILVK